ncbi:Retinoic acid induced 16-like protein-domain-containing protein [Sordaria brevicollis]|uniref:Retinoic acid induced 16-like protein-domain-containing protein n=1 Tax=Sordaria brevicollis TaxID=83679 RepID=A0AAE0PM76_SORBR|nr:Retinoic acid induced 16-like protein-domain-containing protein [Sordaria brevicollis]
MDFWSRLIAHTLPSTGNSRNWKDFAKDPVRRLQRFEKEYSQLLGAWRNSPNIAHDDEAAERIEICLQELTNILTDENRRPLPHPCITFCATKQIYIPIAKISTSSFNEWVIKEAVLFFATLIESEEEAFVENDHFSASLTHLMVRITGANAIRLSADTEARVVELAFNITTKIRLDPEILPAWFKSQSQNGEERQPLGEHERFTGRTQKQDFPLFYLLMDYIHHEGKVGDFARTGLLYIIEAASSSVELEQWIVESDLSTLMATGLGALYSQLSRKLVIDHPSNALPAILALSDYEHPKPSYEVISSCTFEFQSHLDTFLSHLLFWQDVLNHCRSVEVKSSLLEHFQVIFLQQLLYPSLLESSDIDGGSSVAVLTYLRHILQSVEHPDMINLILHYLLGLPDIVGSVSSNSKDGISAARKRKSMDLATMMASKSEAAADPLLFNLVDLILACLRSQSHQTIYVTLQLVSVILKRHHRYAVITLLYTEGVLGNSSFRTTGAHEQEVEYLMGLAQTIGGEDNFNEIYDSVIKDTMIRVENHPCSMKLITPKALASNHKQPAIPDSLPGAPRDVRSHTLHPDDPLLTIVLDRLETFFINPVETNLSLTEVIFDLAICGYMHLEGWFLRHPTNYTYDEEDPEAPAAEPPADIDPESPEYAEYQQLLSMHQCRRRPQWSRESLPRLLRILQTLCDEVAAYRDTIPRFNDLLQQRREAFQTADGASIPPSVPPSVVPSAAPSRSRTPSTLQPPAQLTPGLQPGNAPERPTSGLGIESFAQRIFSDLSSTVSVSPNRTANNSPRPRSNTTRTVSERSSYFTSSEAPPPLPPRNRTPSMLVTSPGMGQGGFGLGASGSSLGGASVPGAVASDISGSGKMELVMSQARAFQAVDQSILARRVGIPDVSATKSVGFDGQAESKTGEELEMGEVNGAEGEGNALPRMTVHLPPPKGEDGGLDALEGDEEDEEERRPVVPPKDDDDDDEQPPTPPAKEGVDEAATPADAAQTDGSGEQPTDQQQQTPEEANSSEEQKNLANEERAAKEAAEEAARKAQQQAEEAEEEEARKASVSHVLTNVIILQSFLFELASLVQVRAGVFEEVRFV